MLTIAILPLMALHDMADSESHSACEQQPTAIVCVRQIIRYCVA